MDDFFEPGASPDVVDAAWSLIDDRWLNDLVDRALAEDAPDGDITTALTVEPSRMAHGYFVVQTDGIVAGMPAARRVFQRQDPTIRWLNPITDGSFVEDGDILAAVEGPAAALLTAERVALNLMQRMSGIATLTASYVERVSHTHSRILDTRKTVPGLRPLDKYAVVCGGGHNHRFGLSDGILIKDNHIRAAGGIAEAVRGAQTDRPHGLKVEVEVENLDQLEEALGAGADVLLLDNMSLDTLRKAVATVDGRAVTEASGGITLDTVQAVAETGVDLISVGALTHSAPALDIGLEFTI